MPFETDAVDFKGPPLDCNVRSRIMGLGCSSVTLKDELMGDDDFVYRVVGSWADPKKSRDRVGSRTRIFATIDRQGEPVKAIYSVWRLWRVSS
jgi:hypothetical protein